MLDSQANGFLQTARRGHCSQPRRRALAARFHSRTTSTCSCPKTQTFAGIGPSIRIMPRRNPLHSRVRICAVNIANADMISRACAFGVGSIGISLPRTTSDGPDKGWKHLTEPPQGDSQVTWVAEFDTRDDSLFGIKATACGCRFSRAAFCRVQHEQPVINLNEIESLRLNSSNRSRVSSDDMGPTLARQPRMSVRVEVDHHVQKSCRLRGVFFNGVDRAAYPSSVSHQAAFDREPDQFVAFAFELFSHDAALLGGALRPNLRVQT